MRESYARQDKLVTALVGLDGRELDADIVAPSQASVRHVVGFSSDEAEFLAKNLPRHDDIPDRNGSKSQRQAYAMYVALMKMTQDNQQLYILLAALSERLGGNVRFTQDELRQYSKRSRWAAVNADAQGNIIIGIPEPTVEIPTAPAEDDDDERDEDDDY